MVLIKKMRKQGRLTGSKHLTLASRGNYDIENDARFAEPDLETAIRRFTGKIYV
jgi:hypothetical protein